MYFLYRIRIVLLGVTLRGELIIIYPVRNINGENYSNTKTKLISFY